MRQWHKAFRVYLLWLTLPACCLAAPDLRTKRVVEAMTVFQDDQRQWVYYYTPGELSLGRTSRGKPDLSFLQMRYTGSAAMGDKGTIVFRSLLNFRVVMQTPSAAQLAEAKRLLSASNRGEKVELKPLPIHRLDAVLVYTPVGLDELAEGSKALPAGYFDASDETETGYWSERVYTLSLDVNSSQVFQEVLQKGQVALSLGYAFYTRGIPETQPSEALTGSAPLVAELRRRLDARPINDRDQGRGENPLSLVKAGAFAVTLDREQWRESLRKVDLNEGAPPGYAVLALYCYDFNNGIRPDLFEKQVEIKATGVSGREVKATAYFNRLRPEQYARSVRFSVAVRMDRPYSYRAIEIGEDGRSIPSPWQKAKSWAPILDITSSSGSRGAAPDQANSGGKQ